MTPSAPITFAAGLAGGLVASRVASTPAARFAALAGSSIAGRDAAGWITDFLNAAYFRRPEEAREVDDLRLAFAIVTTQWHRQGGRRLRASDVVAFHRAFGRERFLDGAVSPRGTLDRGQLLAGAERLHGGWFAEAYADDARRGWGIAFPTVAERDAYDPEQRLALARVGELTPPSPPAQLSGQVWHTYPPLQVPSAAGVIAALSRPETWPDYASEIGRFTPLRRGGLLGQTFEIEVAAGTQAGRPVFQRGYVTVTRLVSQEGPDELRAYVDELNDHLERFGQDEPPAVPPGAEPILAFDLTTHEGHFMGASRNRLVLFAQDGRELVRAAGTWNEMPWHLAQAYRLAGRDAQHQFWGQGNLERRSMLHQIALAVGRGGA
jgi:hypothetical protein